MLNIYMEDAEINGDRPEMEAAVQIILNTILSGRTTTTDGVCVCPGRFASTMSDGMLLTLDDYVSLSIEPVLNKHGEPELAIECCTGDRFQEVYDKLCGGETEETGAFSEAPVSGFLS